MSLPRPKAAIVAALMIAAGLPFLGPLPAHAGGPPGPRAAAAGVQPRTAPSADSDAEEHTPLRVELTSMAPATIPRRGRIVLQGTVTNDSSQTWRDVNVLPFFNANPITSRDELAEQARTDESAVVGQRITDPTIFASIGDLAPGEETGFRIDLPRDRLRIGETPGVYWIGAHALGETDEGRDEFADGRVRTFIPLLPRGHHASVALVFPLRQQVERRLDGRVADEDSWATRLSDQGRLGRILDLADSADGQPITWLIDPAVLDAAADLAQGNKPLSLGVPRPLPTPGTPSPSTGSSEAPEGDSPDADTAGRAEATPDGSTGGAGTARVTESVQQIAGGWLEGVLASARKQVVLGLGYGDPDVAALARRQPSLLSRALQQATARFAERNLQPGLAVAPPGGWLDDDSLEALHRVDSILLADHGATLDRTLWRTRDGAGLVLGDDRVVEGGPAPSPALGALALRQRILSDAALLALSGATAPMPVVLPADWDPGPHWESAEFFAGLRQRWLSLVALGGDAAGRPTYDRPLRYPARARRLEIGRTAVRSARALVDVGQLYDQLLDTTNDVLPRLTGAALEAVSYHARDETDLGQSVRTRAVSLRERLDKVRVELGTDFVTMSGGQGTLTVSLVNDLPQPVTVGLRATTPDSDVRITAPDPVRIGPGERVSVRLQAAATSIGVHEVELTPVTTQGRAFGEPLTFNLRTSEVGRLIWYLMIGVGVLFVAAIVVRVVRRVRAHRRPA